MNFFNDNEYQDRFAVGSLVGALGAWQTLVAANGHSLPQQLEFQLVCSSESRARRLAGFLRRNRACVLTRVNYIEAARRADWRVDGMTRREVQSLGNLEVLFTWLRRAAHSHQVKLLNVQLISSSQ